MSLRSGRRRESVSRAGERGLEQVDRVQPAQRRREDHPVLEQERQAPQGLPADAAIGQPHGAYPAGSWRGATPAGTSAGSGSGLRPLCAPGPAASLRAHGRRRSSAGRSTNRHDSEASASVTGNPTRTIAAINSGVPAFGADDVDHLEQHPDVQQVDRIGALADVVHHAVVDPARRASGADLQREQPGQHGACEHRGHQRLAAEGVVDRGRVAGVVEGDVEQARERGCRRGGPGDPPRAGGAAAEVGDRERLDDRERDARQERVDDERWAGLRRDRVVAVLAQPDAHEREARDERECRPRALERGADAAAEAVGDRRRDRDREVERDLGVQRPGLAERDDDRAAGVALREREHRQHLPPGRRGGGAGRVVGRRADRAVEAEAQEHDRHRDVEDRHDPQRAVAGVAAHGRARGAEHERAHERPADEIARQDEEQHEREVEVADDLLRPAVVLDARAGVGVDDHVAREDQRRRDRADRVAADEVADEPVAEGAVVQRAIGGRVVAHPRRSLPQPGALASATTACPPSSIGRALHL